MSELSFQTFAGKTLSKIPFKSVQAVMDLVEEGGTVPFIARYRKEKTGNLDEVQIREVLEAHTHWDELLKRRTFILKEVEGQGNLTEELKKRIEDTLDLAELEEIYRPYKRKKKTKATLAREGGLEPLSNWLWGLAHGDISDDTAIEVKAKEFLNVTAGFVTYELVLKGAQDIIVEKIYNEPDLRAFVREDYLEKGKIVSKKGKKYKDKSKYEMYAEFTEPVKDLLVAKASHRYLAMRRGWQESELTLAIEGSEEAIVDKFTAFALTKPESQAAEFMKSCVNVAFKNHVHASISNEVHRELKKLSDTHAIDVFSENVRQLLLASPFGPRCVLGVDPGLKTGCKVALVDKAGAFISHTVMQILGEGAEENAKKLVSEVSKQIKIDAIAVGNGTAGRETEKFLRKIVKDLELETPVVLVNESGASVYSASEVAREEFPELDLTVRGAISIARRLKDPLAELVKIEPKSIGVGQYQHDVNQSQLKKSLEAVVEDCVNLVGVDVNTASPYLLAHVSGIGKATAKKIVDHREKEGLFEGRSDLMNVSGFSTKVFEQSAGFLRVREGKMALDSTGIHPERYPAVREMAGELGIGVAELMGTGAKKLLDIKEKWVELVGEFTFTDIVAELEKPGRDPRQEFHAFSFRDDIFELSDVKEGMICPGIVTNVTNFGAFVDIGVHQDGLVHISELSQNFVNDTRKIVKPGDQVKVKVKGLDLEKHQISLTMKWDTKPDKPNGGRKKRPSGGKPPRGKGTDKNFKGKGRPGGGKGRPGGGPKGPHKGGKPGGKKPGQPFNNPFAALAGMKTKD